MDNDSDDRRPRIDVVGLGPAGPGLVTAATMELIESIEHHYLRTRRHPAASLIDGTSFDDVYESAADFGEVYARIADELVAAAQEHGRVLYAVPGSPRVAEQTVDLLAARSEVRVVLHPALSFLDLTWVALGVDPIEHGVRIVDGHRFSSEAAGSSGPLLISQCHSRQVLSDIKLSVDDPTDLTATVLQNLGGPDERIFRVHWSDLDRTVEANHLTSLYVESLPVPVGEAFARFDVMVRRLRQECPWDADQTHATLRRYLLEESYETLEALDRLDDADRAGRESELEDRYADLREELGDLLYQIFFHAILATEQGWFDVAAVAQGIHDKLFERHPHVYGDVEASLEDLPAMWEAGKRAEKGRSSVMDGIPAALPALLYATKVQKKAMAIGQSGPDSESLRRLGALASDTDIGELLFSVVALARSLDIDAESALRQHAVAYAEAVRATET